MHALKRKISVKSTFVAIAVVVVSDIFWWWCDNDDDAQWFNVHL